jgi:hypothetical protein
MPSGKINIISYNKFDHIHLEHQLGEMLKEMSKELYGAGFCNLRAFVDRHWAIYLALDGDKLVGLSSFIFQDYFGLRLPTIGNSYLYVHPDYRRGRVMYLLAKQMVLVSQDTNLPIEAYYASGMSKKMAEGRIKGKFLYDVYEYSPEAMREGGDTLKN